MHRDINLIKVQKYLTKYYLCGFRRNEDLIDELNKVPPHAKDIHFSTKYSQSYFTQFQACLWKLNKSYWRNVPYNAVRLCFAAVVGLMYGTIFWSLGKRKETRQDIFNSVGAMATVIGFLGSQSAATVRPVAIAERTVFYRETVAGMYSALPYAFSQVHFIHSPTSFLCTNRAGPEPTLSLFGLSRLCIPVNPTYVLVSKLELKNIFARW